jgi:hypothetical protein
MFCAVKTDAKPPAPDPFEPFATADAVTKWGVDYIVLTSGKFVDAIQYMLDFMSSTTSAPANISWRSSLTQRTLFQFVSNPSVMLIRIDYYYHYHYYCNFFN